MGHVELARRENLVGLAMCRMLVEEMLLGLVSDRAGDSGIHGGGVFKKRPVPRCGRCMDCYMRRCPECNFPELGHRQRQADPNFVSPTCRMKTTASVRQIPSLVPYPSCRMRSTPLDSYFEASKNPYSHPPIFSLVYSRDKTPS